MNINDLVKQPTLREWDKKHTRHKRELLIGKDYNGKGPDLRIIKCKVCKEYFVLDYIVEQENELK